MTTDKQVALLCAPPRSGWSLWPWQQEQSWTLWTKASHSGHWMRLTLGCQSQQVQALCWFSLEDLLEAPKDPGATDGLGSLFVCDLLLDLPSPGQRCVRRYWIDTGRQQCSWQDLASGPILAAVTSGINGAKEQTGRPYRYLFVLEQGLVRKLDLLRATQTTQPVASDSAQLELVMDEGQQEQYLRVKGPQATTSLNMHTLQPK